MMWVVLANTQFATVTEKTISGVHVSPGSAEALVKRGWITNHHLIAYSLSNIFAKNYQNRLMCVKLWCATSVSFFWDSVLRVVYNNGYVCAVLQIASTHGSDVDVSHQQQDE